MANVAPSRIIAGAATNLITPTDVALDKVRNLLYVADDVDIHVFASASTVNGNHGSGARLDGTVRGVRYLH